jgi:ferredoxin
MSIHVRDGKFDVAVVAGPRIQFWPSAGVRALSGLCSEMGLEVGLFGGDTIRVRGVLPLPGTGGLVLAEDVQHRVHRIHARAIVKVTPISGMPDPFPGWRSEGMIPITTAERLLQEVTLQWAPATVVLGSGNRGLRFASRLLESGVPEVICVESYAQWGAKRFAGWEVERRRFEILGGKMIEGKPLSLSRKAPMLWEFKLADPRGVRVLEVGRVVSAGPFGPSPGVREYPPASYLFELEQTAADKLADDVEGWLIEEERGRWLAGRIVRALATEIGDGRERLDRIFNRAKNRIRRYDSHREQPFTPVYSGKWIAPSDARAMRAFSGVPQQRQKTATIASIECFEEIPCNLCELACPENAIELGRVPRQATVLNESKCTGCGACLGACPSGTPVMVREKEDQSLSELVFPVTGKKTWTPGEFATLLNRRGENLGTSRVLEARDALVRLEVPTHLLWEARGIRAVRLSSAPDESFLESVRGEAAFGSTTAKVDITLNGERRLVNDGGNVSKTLFATGHARAEDTLYCTDGSCGLCAILIDGSPRLACQTEVRRGMNVKNAGGPAPKETDLLCPCLGLSMDQVVERLKHGKLRSPEAVLSVVHVGEGRCHGQVCMEAFRRVLESQGLDAFQWTDWRFPWSDWTLPKS